MKKLMIVFALGFAGTAMMLTSGCRNHLEDVETTTTDYERKVLHDIPVVESLERDENKAVLRFKVTGNKTSQVKVYQVHNTISRFTPYQWWREFYEVPMGLVLMPFGIVSHVLNVGTLGIFPYSWCWELDCFSMAALNPGLNTESTSRYDEEPLLSRRDLVDTKEENQAYPMRKTMLILKAGDAIRKVTTDDSGVAKFELMEFNGKGITLDGGEREVRLYVGNNAKHSFNRIISRELHGRLVKARRAIMAYNANKTGANLAKCITELEKLKFPNLSYYLEQKELKEHRKDDKFRTAFEDAISK